MIANSGIVLKDGTLVVVREYAESDLSKFKEFIHSISDSAREGERQHGGIGAGDAADR